MRLPLVVIALLLASCQQPPSRDALTHGAKGAPPEVLSAWQLFEIDAGVLRPTRDGVVYELNTPLFSDYAHKLRAVHVPSGAAIRYGEHEFQFPIGTIITKTFYYPRADVRSGDRAAVRKVLHPTERFEVNLSEARLLETRLLVNTSSGWVALPYVWNESQTEAILALAGDELELELVDRNAKQAFVYQVPDANQCASCHAADFGQQRIEPIGIKARHLNREVPYPSGTRKQLVHWARTRILDALPDPGDVPRVVRWDDEAADLNARARAYLDVNCGHCHSATANANTSGLFLDASEANLTRLGVCKVPVATGRGAGTGSFDIVPGAPEESILLQRMIATEPDVAMPEIGRAVVHIEGAALIRSWIASMSGGCAVDSGA